MPAKYDIDSPEFQIEPLIRDAIHSMGQLSQQRHGREDVDHLVASTVAKVVKKLGFDDEWQDRKDEFSDDIALAHPTVTNNYKHYEIAETLVHNRHSKFALVNMVTWLIWRNDRLESSWKSLLGKGDTASVKIEMET